MPQNFPYVVAINLQNLREISSMTIVLKVQL